MLGAFYIPHVSAIEERFRLRARDDALHFHIWEALFDSLLALA